MKVCIICSCWYWIDIISAESKLKYWHCIRRKNTVLRQPPYESWKWLWSCDQHWTLKPAAHLAPTTKSQCSKWLHSLSACCLHYRLVLECPESANTWWVCLSKLRRMETRHLPSCLAFWTQWTQPALVEMLGCLIKTDVLARVSAGLNLRVNKVPVVLE